MGQIKLSSYIKEIEKEFESGQYTQVIAHCRQILKQYPRYIGAYRLIGMALMEQQAFTEAEDIYQRVLSLDISDFVSHKGLAEIMAETGRIEQAIWHIEHAFEIDPNHADVIHLREQYYRRAGVSAPVVNGMPLASVARLYVKSGIYDQAIEELNRMLDHNQDRLDWKAILAVAYWRDGRNSEALQLGETVLEILPNNYQARMILGDIWWQNDRQDIAAPHLDILQQTLLLDQNEKENFPTAGQVLEQTERIPATYMVESLSSSEIDDWSSRSWESKAVPSNAEGEEESVFGIESDESFLDSDLSDTVLSGDDQDSPSDSGGLFESDDGVNELDSENALDDLFGSLDDDPSLVDSDLLSSDSSWEENRLGTGLLDSFAADIESFSDEDSNGSESVDSELDESFSWLGSDDDDDLFQTADNPDPISDSELNQLPDISSLFDEDFESDSEPEGQIADQLEESILSTQESRIEDTLIDELPALTLDSNSDTDDSLGFLNEDGVEVEDLFGDDLAETGALLPLPDEDDIDAFEWPEPDEDAAETDLKALFDEPAADVLESDNEVADDPTGFTGWLEDEESSDLAESEPQQLHEVQDEYDSSGDALAGGLFEFLSDRDNQLNPLPEPVESTDTIDTGFDDLMADDGLADELSEITVDNEIADESADSDEDDFNDLFDTSWLDAEPSEEIDLLKDTNEELDLKSFADSLDGGFEFLNSEDENEDSRFQPQDDFDSLFDSPSEPSLDLEETKDTALEPDHAFADEQEDQSGELEFLDEFDILAKEGTSEFDWIADEEEPLNPNVLVESSDHEKDLEQSHAIDSVDVNESVEFGDDLLVEDLSFLDGVLDDSDEEIAEPDLIETGLEQEADDASFIEDFSDFVANSENDEPEELAQSGDLSFLDAIDDSDKDGAEDSLDDAFSFDDVGENEGLEELAQSADLSFLDAIADSDDGVKEDSLDDTFSFDAVDDNDSLDELAQSGDLSFLDAIADPDEDGAENNLGDAFSFDDITESDIVAERDSEVQESDFLSEGIPDELNDGAEVDSDSSAIDWLIPEQETSDDLSWLSLLEDATAPKDGQSVEDKEDDAIWTSDLSAAANPILSPNFDSDENSTEDPQDDSSPDWLIEFPEYNDVNVQTGRLDDEPFHDTGRFTKQILPEIGQPHETESRVSAAPQEEDIEDPEFDPVIFRESTAIKLPDWLSDTTETASLGFEPDPVLDAELDVFEEATQPDKVSEENTVEAVVENTDHASDGALLFPEDDLDMERDKDGNPIPPESQDLEDTLNWLEELAILDVHGEEAPIEETVQKLDLGQHDEAVDEEPISDIFSGGSSLHAFADLEDVGEATDSPTPDGADVSEETLTWLDDLFTPTEEPASEFPTSTWDASNELLDLTADVDIDAESDSDIEADLFDSAESIIEEATDVEIEPEQEIETVMDSASVPAEREKSSPSMFGDDDIHISEEEISQAAEFGDAVPGMEDLPDDPDALMAWLNLDSTDEATEVEATEVEASAVDAVEEAVSDVSTEIDQPETLSLEVESVEAEVESKPAAKAPSMFGDDDIHISEEEISQAAEFGDAVPGMEDMPDDPEALMAWLNLDSTDETSEVEASAVDAVEEAVSDVSTEIDQPETLSLEVESVEAEVESKPAAKAPSMFGDDDIHISEEEISQAAEFGDAVPGMEDMPDDPEALMAWLNIDSTDETSEVEASAVDAVEEAVSDVSTEIDQPETLSLEVESVEAEVESKPAAKAPSMFGDDDIHISEEEISQAAEFGDAVPGMEDMPDDPEALMAWLNLAPDELDDDSDFSDTLQTSEADLIVADLGDEAQEAELSATDTDTPASGTDELDDLFDELAGSVEGDISNEDLIFGDLGTGRLSGTDWLDKMTFDSDPALLGEVPTIPPQLTPNGLESDLSGDIADNSQSEVVENIDGSEESIGSLEELPDDPDEFLKILESNVTDDVPVAEDEELPINLELEGDGIEGDATVPDWLQVEPESADSNLGWLDDASPSGVFNWLEAEENAEASSPEPAEGRQEVVQTGSKPQTASMFDTDPAPVEDNPSSSAQSFQAMLASGENIPDVIRQIRGQLEIRNDSTLQKLLGDAYMETGQLQDALDAYRQAQRLL